MNFIKVLVRDPLHELDPTDRISNQITEDLIQVVTLGFDPIGPSLRRRSLRDHLDELPMQIVGMCLTCFQITPERSDLDVLVRSGWIVGILLIPDANGVKNRVGQADNGQRDDERLVDRRELFPGLDVEVCHEADAHGYEQPKGCPYRVLVDPCEDRVDLFSHL